VTEGEESFQHPCHFYSAVGDKKLINQVLGEIICPGSLLLIEILRETPRTAAGRLDVNSIKLVQTGWQDFKQNDLHFLSCLYLLTSLYSSSNGF
jgi:hypothetical protein